MGPVGTEPAVLGMGALASWPKGILADLAIQATAPVIAGAAGVWLFCAQDQFADADWEHRDHRGDVAAALRGNSFYHLPRPLKWFTGNIGVRHIHHLTPGTPNYNPEMCCRANPLFHGVSRIPLLSSVKPLTFCLRGEEWHTWIEFGYLRSLRRVRPTARGVFGEPRLLARRDRPCSGQRCGLA
jgi:omega-6 fatty acid desaturase (delta-12 desaturase)